ncbi:MAG: hypothetical protein IPM45_18160 [Acidimicrobiales bacterium]|nr:hypothetical protein [Acidimicrobiales bacterium]
MTTDDTARLVEALDRLAGQGINGEALLLHQAHVALCAYRRYEQMAGDDPDLAAAWVDMTSRSVTYWALVDGDEVAS